MPVVAEIEDLRRLAKKRVAKAIFGYVDSGSYSQGTLRANKSDLDAIGLRQRVAVNVAQRNTRTTLIGHEARMPVALAPVGLTGLNHGDGEILAAQAAEEFGVPFTLTTMSICSIEDVAAATTKPFWFQLYVMRDRAFAADLIRRAKEAGCSALVLTLGPADPRPAPCRPAQRPDRAPEADAGQHPRHGMQAPLVRQRPDGQAQDLRQPGRSCEGRRQALHLDGLGGPAVRPHAQLGRCGMGAPAMGAAS